MNAVRVGGVAAVLVALATSPTFAQSDGASDFYVAPIIVECVEHLDAARYNDAIACAREVLESPEASLDRARRNVVALEVIATAQLAMRANGEAATTLHELFARDPEHQLRPGASPPIETAFGRARAQAARRGSEARVQTEDRTATDPREGDRLRLTLGVNVGADLVATVDALSRAVDATTPFTRRSCAASGDDEWSCERPASEIDAAGVAYYFEVRAPSGAVLARRGSENEPLTRATPRAAPPPELLAVPPEPDGERVPSLTVARAGPAAERDGESILESPWFWVITGSALVAGAIVAGYFLLGPPSEPSPGTLGTLRL